jgi:hypothetical protein
MQTSQMKSSFAGNAQVLGSSNGGRTVALFKAPAKGTKQIKKVGTKTVAPARKQAAKITKSLPVPSRKPPGKSGKGAKGARPSPDPLSDLAGVSPRRDSYSRNPAMS